MARNALVGGALAGCRLCNAILTGLRWGSGDTVHMELEPSRDKYLECVLDGVGEEDMSVELNLRMAYVAREGGEWCDVAKVLVWKEDEGGFPPQVVLEMEVAAEDGDHAAKHISGRRANPAVSSEESFSKARMWMEDCTATHASCPKLGSARLPTRVLDIEPLDRHENPRVYITRGESARYVALSYCWGGPQPLTSTTATIDSNVRGIALKSLPQTLKDAITVTRKMGCRYLWIDALCILQDSDDDKSREIGQMARIYRDSYCTISAASAKAVKDGFLQDRPYLGIKGDWFTVPYCCPDSGGLVGAMHLRSEARYEATKEPINQRAWTLQEHLLPPRLLIYDSYRLRWECQGKRASDGGAPNLLRTLDFGRIPQSLREKVLAARSARRDEQQPLPHPSSDEPSLFRCWARTLENYARRQLSVAADKLPAVSAFAQDYADITGDKYLAGLWQRHLGSSLMWACQVHDGFGRKGEKSSRPAAYRAPSWSWASIDNRKIFVEQVPYPGDVELVRYNVEPLSLLVPFGAVACGASVTLRGLCRDVAVRFGWRGGYVDLWDPAGDRADKLGQCAPDSPDELPREQGGEEVVRCLAVAPTAINDGSKGVRGLVLRSVGTDRFSRVGTFSVLDRRLKTWLSSASRETVVII
ncbi:heterokaryon incompatibility protein-domain-containing protein [Lasiosphaeris hirsuta]|uniref:Heterokaryon incompatibility protein-domain-containing protein n=1 Tax=Lasiosphaeris hirsuta TaxID=260670 RepID=A0AA40AA46_9PEZI|nr:heterokaryon incompatibility protein-domain-containing protein [Lasiosphaeris hirsuta]